MRVALLAIFLLIFGASASASDLPHRSAALNEPKLGSEKPTNNFSGRSTEEKTTCYDEVALAEHSDQLLPGYMLGEVNIEGIDNLSYPFAHFVISYRPIEGVAHLISQDKVHAPKREARSLGRLPDWSDRISFFREGPGWTKITLNDARKIFGEPMVRGVGETQFFAFDAYATVQKEKQLFHLDLRFGGDGAISSYRVRGIGIRNPQWVTD